MKRMASPLSFKMHIQTALHDNDNLNRRIAQPIRQNNPDHWSANSNDNRTRVGLG